VTVFPAYFPPTQNEALTRATAIEPTRYV